MRPLRAGGVRVWAVGAKRKDVAACVDLWPAVIARAGSLQLAYVSYEGGLGVFFLDAKMKTKACDALVCRLFDLIPCVSCAQSIAGHRCGLFRRLFRAGTMKRMRWPRTDSCQASKGAGRLSLWRQ